MDVVNLNLEIGPQMLLANLESRYKVLENWVENSGVDRRLKLHANSLHCLQKICYGHGSDLPLRPYDSHS